ncbi:MAG: hypothetical protein WBG18_11055, partial [Xanthobacteraceae bacterium]
PGLIFIRLDRFSSPRTYRIDPAIICSASKIVKDGGQHPSLCKFADVGNKPLMRVAQLARTCSMPLHAFSTAIIFAGDESAAPRGSFDAPRKCGRSDGPV